MTQFKLNVPARLASTAIQVRPPSYTVAPQSNTSLIASMARQVPATVKSQPTQSHDLSEVWQSNVLVAEEPPSNIKLVQRAIVAMYAERGIQITPEDVNYFDDCIGFYFNTRFFLHSDEGSLANQFIQKELSRTMGKKVAVGGDEHRVRVWIDK